MKEFTKIALTIVILCTTIITMCSFTANVGDYIQPKNRTANVRYKATSSSTRVAILDKTIDKDGALVTDITSEASSGTIWYKISFERDGIHHVGWCSSTVTALKSSKTNIAIAKRPTLPSKSAKISYAEISSKRGLNLRTEPTISSNIICTIPNGTKICILESDSDSEGWYKTTFNQITGWVNSKFINIISEKQPNKNLYLIEKKLASFSTSFKGSSRGRIQNIRQTCLDLNNTIVPGSGTKKNRTFNWFSVMPETTYKNGYTMATVFANGKSVQGMGGGLCQVTSTLYNVCLQLPDIICVSKRTPHGLPVSYVPKGKDATISRDSGINFKFINNSGKDIRIKAYTNDYICTVEFYSIGI